MPWAFPHQLASFNVRQAECCKVGGDRAKSPVLEYGTRNEVSEGKARAQVTSSLGLRGPTLGLWELGKDADELCGAETSHPPSPTTT